MFHEETIQERRRKWGEMGGGKKALMIAGTVAAVAAALALAGLAVMLLWNRIMSGALGLHALGFWEALGLFVLAKVLVGGRHSSFFGRMRMRRAMRERMARRAEGDEGNKD